MRCEASDIVVSPECVSRSKPTSSLLLALRAAPCHAIHDRMHATGASSNAKCRHKEPAVHALVPF